jgi:hypothetical protein
MICIVCQTLMKPLLNGFFCPKDCDRQPVVAICDPVGQKLPAPPPCWPDAKVYTNAGQSIISQSNFSRYTKDGDSVLFYYTGSRPFQIATGWLNPVHYLYGVSGLYLISPSGVKHTVAHYTENIYPYFAVKN